MPILLPTSKVLVKRAPKPKGPLVQAKAKPPTDPPPLRLRSTGLDDSEATTTAEPTIEPTAEPSVGVSLFIGDFVPSSQESLSIPRLDDAFDKSTDEAEVLEWVDTTSQQESQSMNDHFHSVPAVAWSYVRTGVMPKRLPGKKWIVLPQNLLRNKSAASKSAAHHEQPPHLLAEVARQGHQDLENVIMTQAPLSPPGETLRIAPRSKPRPLPPPPPPPPPFPPSPPPRTNSATCALRQAPPPRATSVTWDAGHWDEAPQLKRCRQATTEGN